MEFKLIILSLINLKLSNFKSVITKNVTLLFLCISSVYFLSLNAFAAELNKSECKQVFTQIIDNHSFSLNQSENQKEKQLSNFSTESSVEKFINTRRYVNENILFALRQADIDIQLLNNFTEYIKNINSQLKILNVTFPPTFLAIVSKKGSEERVGFREMLIHEVWNNYPVKISPKDWVHEYGHLIFLENLARFDDHSLDVFNKMSFKRKWISELRFFESSQNNSLWKDGDKFITQGKQAEAYSLYQSALDLDAKLRFSYANSMKDDEKINSLFEHNNDILFLLDASTPFQELIGDLLVEMTFKDGEKLELPEPASLLQFRKFTPHLPTQAELDLFSTLNPKYKQDPYHSTFQTRRTIAVLLSQLKTEKERWLLFKKVFLISLEWVQLLAEQNKTNSIPFSDLDAEIKLMNEFMITRLTK